MKFNVDGSAIGQPGPAGIGGILQNSNSKINDSSNVVKWVKDPGGSPWRFRQIENLEAWVTGWFISHTAREAKDIPDRLAKTGVNKNISNTNMDCKKLRYHVELIDII
ncbi:hypothetical protein DITRI_Ditri20bG0088600 [Diplodiscus trichospermus]